MATVSPHGQSAQQVRWDQTSRVDALESDLFYRWGYR